jgi:hypothetical protein
MEIGSPVPNFRFKNARYTRYWKQLPEMPPWRETCFIKDNGNIMDEYDIDLNRQEAIAVLFNAITRCTSNHLRLYGNGVQ